MRSKRLTQYLDNLPLAYQGHDFIAIISQAVEIAETEMQEEVVEPLWADNVRWRQALQEANERLAIAAKVIAEKNAQPRI